MLSDFFHHIPVPHSSSMMGLDDSVDGHIEPVLYAMVMVSGTLFITLFISFINTNSRLTFSSIGAIKSYNASLLLYLFNIFYDLSFIYNSYYFIMFIVSC